MPSGSSFLAQACTSRISDYSGMQVEFCMLKDEMLMISYTYYFSPQNCYMQGDGKDFCAAFR